MTESEKDRQVTSWRELWRDGRPHTFEEIYQCFGGNPRHAVQNAILKAVARGDLDFDGRKYFATPDYLGTLGIEILPGKKIFLFSAFCGKCCEHTPALKRAVAWLRAALQEPRWADDVQRLADEAGISPATLRRAKKAIGVGSRKMGGPYGGDPRWQWRLDEVEEEDIENDDVAVWRPATAAEAQRREASKRRSAQRAP
jgi:hypothetical protein